MSEPEPAVLAVSTAECWADHPPQLRAALEARDGPYQRVPCGTCGQPSMLGREGRKMLDDGRAGAVICVDCLIAVANKFEQDAMK